jgi:hypothetical protein
MWGFNVMYLMHMCIFRIILGVCASVHEISLMYHWFKLWAVQDHHQFNNVLCFKMCNKFIHVFISFLHIWNLTVTVVLYLVDHVTNCPGVTHTVFFMPACLILRSLLKDICCILIVGMLVLKANFIHIKFLKYLLQNVLQKYLSLNKPCHIECSNNW